VKTGKTMATRACAVVVTPRVRDAGVARGERRGPARREMGRAPLRARRAVRVESTGSSTEASGASEAVLEKNVDDDATVEGGAEGEEGTACPYTAAKEALGFNSVPPTRPDADGNPAMIDSKSFLKSLVKAAQHPVGMPIAMLDWAAEKGECVGIQNAIGPFCVSILDPEIVEYVCFSNAKNYRLRMLPDAFRYVIKNKGITGSDGQYNREHRLMCQKPFINSFSLSQFSKTVEERIAFMCNTWKSAAEMKGGGPYEINIDVDSQQVTLDVIGKVAFAFDFEQCEAHEARTLRGEAGKNDNISKLLDAYNGSSEIMGELFITPGPILKLQNFLGLGRVRELKEQYSILESVGTKLMSERRAVVAERLAKGDEEDYCLLDVLVKAKDADGNSLSDEDLWGDINDIMAAGHRTTASNFTVNLWHVARYEHIQSKIEEEVAALGGRPPTFKDVQDGKLPYTQRVVKESLRKYAPINLFPRLAEGPDTLPSGHEVKEGDFILLSTYAMGRNPRVWEDPLKFDPDRFTDEALYAQAEKQANAVARGDPAKLEIARERMRRRMSAGRDFTYTPFGAGPRSCIGGVFALLAATTMLASTVQKFRLSRADPKRDKLGDELNIMYDTTICFPEGVWINLKPRDKPLGAE
jgi:cytochrome P450